MKELFVGLTLKQEEDNRRLREENLAIRKQMPELEKKKDGEQQDGAAGGGGAEADGRTDFATCSRECRGGGWCR